MTATGEAGDIRLGGALTGPSLTCTPTASLGGLDSFAFTVWSSPPQPARPGATRSDILLVCRSIASISGL